MSIWYRQSTRPGFNLVPVGLKGTVIFVLNLLAFILPIFTVAFYSVPGSGLDNPMVFNTSIFLIAASVVFFIYSLQYKANYTYD